MTAIPGITVTVPWKRLPWPAEILSSIRRSQSDT
jgi:hypothetical protein